VTHTIDTPSAFRIVLASASPARLKLLTSAGVRAEVFVSHVDEDSIQAILASEGRTEPGDVAQSLAIAKAVVVADELRDQYDPNRTTIIIGCDSVLNLDGVALGKPLDHEDAVARWKRMRGRTGQLCTGHAVIVLGETDDDDQVAKAVAATVVQFAAIDDETIRAYVATGEPLAVAGAFTIDGLGGPFVEFIDGDWSNVVGLSLPLLRHLVSELGIGWTELWTAPTPQG
jgi:septum formation protein